METSEDRPTEGGDALLASLSWRGVTEIFSVSGGPINSAYHASTRSPVSIVHVRHESAAGYMADATYRASGRPGVVLATLGPGVSNTVTPAACAKAAGVPLLVIGGQAPTHQLHRGAGMELPTLSIMEPVVKWSAQVLQPERIPEFVDKAWRHMLAGTPGPVYLEIPVDVLAAGVDRELLDVAPEAYPSSPVPPAEQVQRAADLLRGAARPVVLAGDGVYHSAAESQLARFVEASQVTVATLRLARGAVDERTCQSWMGPGYVPANPAVADALDQADLVVLLGHHWEFDLEFGSGLGPDTKVIQVHHDAAQLGLNGRVDLAIHAGAREFLDSLPDVSGPRDQEWRSSTLGAWKARQDNVSIPSSTGSAMHPVEAVDAVLAVAPETARFITSHGNVDFWADARIPAHGRGRYLRVGQAGALGAEVPFGVGAAIATGDGPSIVFVGDGGIGYHVTELETAARCRVPVIVVVLDDGSWGAIAMPQLDAYGVQVGMDLPKRDWAAVAEGIGGRGYFADTPQDVGAAVGKALDFSGPSIIQVPVQSALSPYMSHISR